MRQILILFFLAFGMTLSAQTSFFTDATYELDLAHQFGSKVNTELVVHKAGQVIFTKVLEVPVVDAHPFLTVALAYDSPVPENLLEQFAIRFSKDGEQWNDWISVEEEIHFPDETDLSKNIGQLIFAEADSRYFQISILPKGETDFSISGLKLFFSCPGDSKIKNHLPPNVVTNRTVCPVPEFQGRNDWCSTSQCPFGSSQSMTNVTHLIVHHSAGGNTSSDWEAVVRSIWHYHVDVKGWDDIGYNWLIDPNGILYQGRKDDVQGAHFSGHNSGTMGVCLLGNFQNANPKVSPKVAAVEKLEHLLCWKSEAKNINPLATKYHASSGLNLKTISGHRDGGATSCPGDSLYVQLPAIRIVVDSLLHPVVGVNEIVKGELVSIYPTLAQNSITIDFLSKEHSKLNLSVFDATGKIMEVIDIQEDRNLDITNYTSGVYFVKLLGEGVVDVLRFVKE